MNIIFNKNSKNLIDGIPIKSEFFIWKIDVFFLIKYFSSIRETKNPFKQCLKGF